jgi:cell wall-associated NlpC family hydrolase
MTRGGGDTREAGKAAQKAAQIARRQARELAVKTAQAGAEVTKFTVQTGIKLVDAAARVVAAAASKLFAALAAALGPVGAVVIIVIAVAAAIFGVILASPFGVFFSPQDNTTGTTTVPGVFAGVSREITSILDGMQTAWTYSDAEVTITGSLPDPAAVVAVWAVKTAAADVAALDVLTIDAARAELLRGVFWDMLTIAAEVEEVERPAVIAANPANSTPAYTEYKPKIILKSRAWTEMPAFYGFSADQRDLLTELMTEYYDMLTDLAGSMTPPADVLALLRALPPDLSPQRRAVVENALSLVGKVNYFWGGKSAAIGWDARWGKLYKVTSAGSPSTGKYRAYGLDCSGFTDWVFVNASGETRAYVILGDGVIEQHQKSAAVSYAAALPGDLAFLADDSHIGIVVGRGADGGLLICHCASGANNVVVSDYNAADFASLATPGYYNVYGG